MNLNFEHRIHARTNCDCVVHRRDFLRVAAAAGAAAGMTSWTDAICMSAEDMRKRGMACILLWMTGGPSQFETFTQSGHENGGETKAIATSIPGIQIAESLPKLAGVMNDLAIIRSMTSKEGSHPRASFLLHHGYLPMGGVKFPTLGSHVAHQIGDPKFDLPSFVRVGGRRADSGGAGFLGVDYDPFEPRNPESKPENTMPATSLLSKQQLRRGATPVKNAGDDDRYTRRLAMLEQLEGDFGRVEGTDIVADHRKLIRKSSEMILSPRMQAFDLSHEPDRVRDAYGRNPFGAGCLLWRRLVETGVTFVEVNLGDWDTHEDNFTRVGQRNELLDQPMAQLITDLKQRGMLDRTLVLWMGEFGRTPRINARAGRDHYPRAFNVALAGGGITGGQVIGETDAGGVEVSDRPVSVSDLLRTVYTTLGIDADRENMSRIGRPIKIVDGGEVVRELLG